MFLPGNQCAHGALRMGRLREIRCTLPSARADGAGIECSRSVSDPLDIIILDVISARVIAHEKGTNEGTANVGRKYFAENRCLYFLYYLIYYMPWELKNPPPH